MSIFRKHLTAIIGQKRQWLLGTANFGLDVIEPNGASIKVKISNFDLEFKEFIKWTYPNDAKVTNKSRYGEFILAYASLQKTLPTQEEPDILTVSNKFADFILDKYDFVHTISQPGDNRLTVSSKFPEFIIQPISQKTRFEYLGGMQLVSNKFKAFELRKVV